MVVYEGGSLPGLMAVRVFAGHVVFSELAGLDALTDPAQRGAQPGQQVLQRIGTALPPAAVGHRAQEFPRGIPHPRNDTPCYSGALTP